MLPPNPKDVDKAYDKEVRPSGCLPAALLLGIIARGYRCADQSTKVEMLHGTVRGRCGTWHDAQQMWIPLAPKTALRPTAWLQEKALHKAAKKGGSDRFTFMDPMGAFFGF